MQEARELMEYETLERREKTAKRLEEALQRKKKNIRKKHVKNRDAALIEEEVSQDRVWRELSKQDQLNNVSRLKQVQTEYKQRLI